MDIQHDRRLGLEVDRSFKAVSKPTSGDLAWLRRNPERFWIPENQKVSRQREAAMGHDCAKCMS